MTRFIAICAVLLAFVPLARSQQAVKLRPDEVNPEGLTKAIMRSFLPNPDFATIRIAQRVAVLLELSF